MPQARQTAYKIWISDLIRSNFVKNEGQWESNYIEFDNKKISRVNIVATITSKYESEDKNFASLTIDDNTASIRVKVWRDDLSLIENFEVGNLILLVGRIRHYNDETYLTPEIIKKVSNPNLELLRKLELYKLYGKPQHLTEFKEVELPQEIKETVTEEIIKDEPLEGNRQLILNLVEKLDKENGAEILEVIKESKLEEEKADLIIQDLLKEGEIFQPSATKLKLVN